MATTSDPPVHVGAVMMTLVVMTSLCDGVKVYDLTHQLKEDEIITWPTNPNFNFSVLHRGVSNDLGGLWYEANKFEMAEHMGTHMDAPAHLGGEGKWRMNQIPPEMLIGPGVVVDVSEKVKDNQLYGMTVQDLKDWESQHGTIPLKAVVLVNFGWAKRYPNKTLVFGSDDVKDTLSFKYPIVTADAAQWLADERDIIALGVDTCSPDRPAGLDFSKSVHKILLGQNLIIIENVAGLDTLPAKGTTVVLGGISIWDGSGAPMRLLAYSGACRPRGWNPAPLAALGAGLMMTALLTTLTL